MAYMSGSVLDGRENWMVIACLTSKSSAKRLHTDFTQMIQFSVCFMDLHATKNLQACYAEKWVQN